MSRRYLHFTGGTCRPRVPFPFQQQDFPSSVPRCINCHCPQVGSVNRTHGMVAGQPCQFRPNHTAEAGLTDVQRHRLQAQQDNSIFYPKSLATQPKNQLPNRPDNFESPFLANGESCLDETAQKIGSQQKSTMPSKERKPGKYPGGGPENFDSSKCPPYSDQNSPSNSPKLRSKFSANTRPKLKDASTARAYDEEELILHEMVEPTKRGAPNSPGNSRGNSPRKKRAASPREKQQSPAKGQSSKVKIKAVKKAKKVKSSSKPSSKTELRNFVGQTDFDRPLTKSPKSSRPPSKTQLRSPKSQEDLSKDELNYCLANPELQEFLACACRMIMKGRSRFQNSAEKSCDTAEVQDAQVMLRNAQRLIEDAANRLVSCSDRAPSPKRKRPDAELPFLKSNSSNQNLGKPSSKTKLKKPTSSTKISSYAQSDQETKPKSTARAVGSDKRAPYLPAKPVRTASSMRNKPTRIPSLKKNTTRSVQAQAESPEEHSLETCLSQLQTLLKNYQSCDCSHNIQNSKSFRNKMGGDGKESPKVAKVDADTSPKKSRLAADQNTHRSIGTPFMRGDRCRESADHLSRHSSHPTHSTTNNRALKTHAPTHQTGMHATNGNWMVDCNFLGYPNQNEQSFLMHRPLPQGHTPSQANSNNIHPNPHQNFAAPNATNLNSITPQNTGATVAPVAQPKRMSNPTLSQGPDMVQNDPFSSDPVIPSIGPNQPAQDATIMAPPLPPQSVSYIQQNEFELKYQEHLIHGPIPHQQDEQFHHPYQNQYGQQHYDPYAQPQIGYENYMNPFEQRQYIPQPTAYYCEDPNQLYHASYNEMGLQADFATSAPMQDEGCQSEPAARRKSKSNPPCAPPPCPPLPCCTLTPCCPVTACGNPCCGAPSSFPERCPCSYDKNNPSQLSRKTAYQNMSKPMNGSSISQRVSLIGRRKDSISGLACGRLIPPMPPAIPMLPSMRNRGLMMPYLDRRQERKSDTQLKMLQRQVEDVRIEAVSYEKDSRVNSYCKELGGGKVVSCVRVDYTAFVQDDQGDDEGDDDDDVDDQCDSFKIEVYPMGKKLRRKRKRMEESD